jgi:hypothetical protein
MSLIYITQELLAILQKLIFLTLLVLNQLHIMSHSLRTWQKIYNFIPYLAHKQTYSFGQTFSIDLQSTQFQLIFTMGGQTNPKPKNWDSVSDHSYIIPEVQLAFLP